MTYATRCYAKGRFGSLASRGFSVTQGYAVHACSSPSMPITGIIGSWLSTGSGSTMSVRRSLIVGRQSAASDAASSDGCTTLDVSGRSLSTASG